MTTQGWLPTAKKGDLVYVWTGNHNLPGVITKAFKLTLYVEKLKFRRKDGTLMRPSHATMTVRGAASYRIVQRECCEEKGVS